MTPGVTVRSGGDAYRQIADRVQEIGVSINRLVLHFDLQIAAQYFLPQDLQLHFRQAIAQTAMDAKAKRHMLARASAIDNEFVWLVDVFLIAIARDVPDHHLVAGLDL